MIDGLARVEVINLVRRPDRLAAFRDEITSVLGRAAADSICVREAVDGLRLVPTPEMGELFGGNWYDNRRAVIGCNLSHALVWADAASADGPVLVFEDDITLDPAFASILPRVLVEAEDRFPGWDVVLLGHFFSDPDFIEPPHPEHVLSPMRWARSWGGTFGYLVSPGGASRLLGLAEANGFKREVDTNLAWWHEYLLVLETNPHIVLSEPVHPDSDGDTDSQRDRSDLWFG